jgi:hypothetical protein
VRKGRVCQLRPPSRSDPSDALPTENPPLMSGSFTEAARGGTQTFLPQRALHSTSCGRSNITVVVLLAVCVAMASVALYVHNFMTPACTCAATPSCAGSPQPNGTQQAAAGLDSGSLLSPGDLLKVAALREHVSTTRTSKVLVYQCENRLADVPCGEVLPVSLENLVHTTGIINRRYTQKHGYDFLRLKASFPDRHPAWCRWLATRALLDVYDYVLYIDSDAYFIDDRRSMEEVCQLHSPNPRSLSRCNPFGSHR